ncbi:MAG: NADH-quinone oxidoreductase subunit J [Gammaproteobacteria bacterium]|nr:NADH-quinone oxidoreductase subunit J [Gammaproteobacteria bacterium]
MTAITFYFFAAVLVISALLVITVRNPVHAALFLVLAFFSSAAVWLLLQAEFLAIALVLVYVGAVMVLFLFVIMMLDVNLAPLREGFARYLPLGLTVAALLVVTMAIVIRSGGINATAPAQDTVAGSNTQLLGQALFTDFLYPFEVAGAVLLVAIIAAIALTLRRRSRQLRTPAPGLQVAVRREDRVRIVKMDAEK